VGVLHIKQYRSLRSLALVFSPLFPSKFEKASKTPMPANAGIG
jgi:hypothetical protein